VSFREFWGVRLDLGLVLGVMGAWKEDTCRAVDGGFSERKSEVRETNSGG
jgi:hypothetical protein